MLSMDNSGQPSPSPSLAPAIPSTPGGIQDPDLAKLWKVIGDLYRQSPNSGGSPTEFLQNLAYMQMGQAGFAANHAMALASGPQPPQPNLTQANPTTQKLFLQQQQQRQRFGADGAFGMGDLQRPGLANASRPLLMKSPALMSFLNGTQVANGMAQPGNQLMNGLVLNPNNSLDFEHRNMLDPGMSKQRARSSLEPGLAKGGTGAAASQPIRPPLNEHNSPLLDAPHDQNPMIQGLGRSPQPDNPHQQYQGNIPQNAQVLALIHKLDSLPVHDLEMRVGTWRENIPSLEARVQELLGAASRPGAPPEMDAAYGRAKSELDQNRFLLIKAEEILTRKHIQANEMAQAQAQANAQAATQLTPRVDELTPLGNLLQRQAPGMPEWQSQLGRSNTPQLPSQGSPPSTSSTPFQPAPSPKPDAEQQSQQASFRQNGQRNTAIPRDRVAFMHLIRLWFIQTGRNVDAIPKIGEKPLDLHQLYIEVETLGGVEKVQDTGLWRLAAVKMGYVTHEQNNLQLAQIAKVLADTYVALLVPFNRFCMDQMHAVGIQNDRLNQMALTEIGMGANQLVPPDFTEEFPAMRGAKRHFEAVDEQDAEERGATPKRSKIIRRDYVDMSPNCTTPPLPGEDTTGGTTQDTETEGSARDVQPTVNIRSGQISCEEMFQHLVDHGCADLSLAIDPRGYSLGLVQGGAFGDIWKGKLRNGAEVAIKVWRFSSIPQEDAKPMKRAMREIYHWSKAKHENIQELMGVIIFQGRLGMVSLWMEHGNLRDYIRKNHDADRLSLCIQVAAGLSYLHDQNMVHGDLKAANILVSHDYVAKICDFDHSILSECTLVFSDTTNVGGGTLRWMAPELLLSSEEGGGLSAQRNKRSDVYALGMTLLETVTGQVPYSEYKYDHGIYRALDKRLPPARPDALQGPDGWGPNVWAILLECWDHDPIFRPSACGVHERLKCIKN